MFKNLNLDKLEEKGNDASPQLTLYTVEGLFMRAKALGKLDEFTNKFWEAFSHNNNLTWNEANKILESI